MSNLSIPTTSPDDYYQQRIDLQPAFNSDLFQQLLEPENLRHCCKVSDEAAFCLIQRPYISKTLLTRRISPRGSP
ncbi:hypothetical protein D1624_29020 [Klebsiella pneumoniae]|nr:hypothetical protein D1624_29020 [Klebsiella pneumoniae]